MGFFGLVLKPGQKEAVEVPEGWILQLCSAALEPPSTKKPKNNAKAENSMATLWVQVEGEIGGNAYLLGTLQGGGPCAQLALTQCLQSVDGEVVIEAKGSGVIHLTGHFHPDQDWNNFMGDESSDDSEEDSEDLEERYGGRMPYGLGMDDADGDGDSEEEDSDDDDDGEGTNVPSGDAVGEVMTKGAKKAGWDKAQKQQQQQQQRSDKKNGRAVRSAAAAAMLVTGSGGLDEDNSEDDSEVDGEYVPGQEGSAGEEEATDGSDSNDDDDDDDDSDGEEEEDQKEEPKEKDKKGKEKGKGKGKGEEKKGKENGLKNDDKKGKDSTGAKRSAAEDSEGSAPATKKLRSEDDGNKSQEQDQEKIQGGEDGGGEGASAEKKELSKAERRRLRKKENKRKAAEAKRNLEEAFSGMNDDAKGELPVGVPLKSPRTKTLKGGLKTKDTILGGGKMAVPGKNVKIVYEGCFPDGRVFDKNQNRRRPLQFRVGMGNVIVGMDRGVEGMRVGGSREIAIPSALGYGSRGTGPIPANQDLVFRVELLDVLGK